MAIKQSGAKEPSQFKVVSVDVGYSQTVNLGDYESFKVAISATIEDNFPAPTNKEDEDKRRIEMTEEGWNFIAEELKKQVSVVTSWRKKNSK